MRISRINHNDLFAIVVKLRQHSQDNEIHHKNIIYLIDLIDYIIDNKIIQIKFNEYILNMFADISLIYYVNKINDVNSFKDYVFNDYDNEYYTYFALSIGAIDTFKWLISHGFSYNMSKILNYLQKNCGMNIFKKIFDDNLFNIDNNIINDAIIAASSNEIEEYVDYFIKSNHVAKITKENLIDVIEYAVKINNCDIIKMLVKKFNFCAKDYRKAFIQAIKNDNVIITKTLLHSLMYRTNKETLISYNSNEALKCAIEMKSYDIIKILIDYNIQTNHVIKYHIEGSLDLKNDDHLYKINKYIDKKLCGKCSNKYNKIVAINYF
ncbi:putative ankyrin repeat protein [Cotonvirus japonicus]|uniref:Ankyrin repeat protein n=1 Tax=Cotonvirus japonicus TaxID=2811091 RepID=A0ABM7NR27_9VIRU|nr:putative ankyrin repeat protein [Cotonvirus japonicus]BCS82611.1 putative ankyrin repeat protein [Cotonvirus japonicus]